MMFAFCSRVLVVLFLCSIGFCNAQSVLKDYKYIVVPDSYAFLNAPDKYRLNTLTRHILKQKGFSVLAAQQIFPEDLKLDKCLALYTDVQENSSMFVTKLTIYLKNCYGEVVFTSKQGTSKAKTYKQAYHTALKDAATSFKKGYAYTANTLTAKKESTKTTNTPKQSVISPAYNVASNALSSFSAEKTDTGYKITNAISGLSYNLQHTSVTDVFILKDKNGIAYKQDGMWFLEYYQIHKKIVLPIAITF